MEFLKKIRETEAPSNRSRAFWKNKTNKKTNISGGSNRENTVPLNFEKFYSLSHLFSCCTPSMEP